MKRKLKVLCPSVTGPGCTLATRVCVLTACSWWKNNECHAGPDTAQLYAKFLDREPLPPLSACAIAFQCRWHLDALKRGEIACPPRRLGMLCEHQGGEWNTFEIAPPEDWEIAEEQD